MLDFLFQVQVPLFPNCYLEKREEEGDVVKCALRRTVCLDRIFLRARDRIHQTNRVARIAQSLPV